MLRRVQLYIRQHSLLEHGQRVLVAISGGADSVALLDVLRRGGYECIAAHCNFHLRGEESNRDEAFVRKLCSTWHVPIEVSEFDTPSYAATTHQSIEMAARELRYRRFDELATHYQCYAIAVAHHQNDQAETIIQHLLRGTGIRGLGGMRPKAPNPIVTNANIPIIRPLLCTTHDYIEHYLKDIRHIEWVIDSTNSDTTIQRNNIRAWLAQLPKGQIENIAHTAQTMQGYADLITHTESREKDLVQLYEQLRTYGFTDIEPIYEALLRGKGGKVFHSSTHTATIRKGKLHIASKIEENKEQ